TFVVTCWLSSYPLPCAAHPPRLFFLMIPRPPRPTLFPYTTLFRSFNESALLAAALAVLARQALDLGRDQRGGSAAGEYLACRLDHLVKPFIVEGREVVRNVHLPP